jgi:hypothetical protein
LGEQKPETTSQAHIPHQAEFNYNDKVLDIEQELKKDEEQRRVQEIQRQEELQREEAERKVKWKEMEEQRLRWQAEMKAQEEEEQRKRDEENRRREEEEIRRQEQAKNVPLMPIPPPRPVAPQQSPVKVFFIFLMDIGNTPCYSGSASNFKGYGSF